MEGADTHENLSFQPKYQSVTLTAMSLRKIVQQPIFNILHPIKIGLEILKLRFPSFFSYYLRIFVPVLMLSLKLLVFIRILFINSSVFFGKRIDLLHFSIRQFEVENVQVGQLVFTA